MSKVDIKTTVTKRIANTVRLSEEQVADILREYVQAPRDSSVEFDIGYDGWLRGVVISWEEVSHED